MTAAGSGKAQTVNVGDNFFTPDSAPVNAGDTVYWIWGGSAGHDVRDGSGNLWCGIRSVGICYRVFPAAGKFRYYCSLHNGMVGTIDVH
jgi:plastocyanin